MNFITLIFAIITKHVPMDATERQSMQIEANAWHLKVLDEKGEYQSAFAKWYRKHSQQWYVRLVTTLSYIPLNVYVGSIMRSSNSIDNPLNNGKDDEFWKSR